jgi:hypothetical protein
MRDADSELRNTCGLQMSLAVPDHSETRTPKSTLEHSASAPERSEGGKPQ